MEIGKKLYFSAGFGITLLVLYFFDDVMFLPVLLSVAVHEIGHICGIRLSGVSIRKFRFQCAGLLAEYDSRELSYPQEVMCALLGPAFSLLSALIFSLWGRFFYSEFAFYTAGISFTFFAFNMLPVSVLDGGRAIFMLTAYFVGADTAEKITDVTDTALTLCLLVLGIFLAAEKHGNGTIIIASLALFILCCKKRKNGVKFYSI